MVYSSCPNILCRFFFLFVPILAMNFFSLCLFVCLPVWSLSPSLSLSFERKNDTCLLVCSDHVDDEEDDFVVAVVCFFLFLFSFFFSFVFYRLLIHISLIFLLVCLVILIKCSQKKKKLTEERNPLKNFHFDDFNNLLN